VFEQAAGPLDATQVVCVVHFSSEPSAISNSGLQPAMSFVLFGHNPLDHRESSGSFLG